MGTRGKMYAVLGAGSVTGMFVVRELLQRGGNVRACMRDPSRWCGDIEQLVSYFPRGKRGVLEFCTVDVTKPETLTDGAARCGSCQARPGSVPFRAQRVAAVLLGCEAVVFTASGSSWAGENGGYDVDYRGVENTAAAAKAAGVRKVVLVSCFMVSGAAERLHGRTARCGPADSPADRQRFSLTRFFLNVGPKWRMMDHKWSGECALRDSGLAYSIVRPGALWMTQDGSGGSSGVGFVVTASQGRTSYRGRIAKSDLAAVVASCALDYEAALNATFDCVQMEPPTRLPHVDDGTRWHGLRNLVSDAAAGGIVHAPWMGLLGERVSMPAQAPLQPDSAPAAERQEAHDSAAVS
jgi:nucleoside-diphosphate-sugar epimerase